MTLATDITFAVGETPLIDLARLIDAPARVLGKLEARNPLGSVKDRIAVSMIDAAERAGTLKPGGVIIEPTSGNTGIGLAMVAAARGYQCILTMPDSMSIERRKVLAALGAKLILTPCAEGMAGAIQKAEELAAADSDAFLPQQFNNPANPQAHYEHTGPEILRDAGNVDVFVAGVGTGGTLTGIGHYLREHNPHVKLFAIEPAESPVLTQLRNGEELTPGKHGIQGIGAGFVPTVLDVGILDGVVQVTTDEAIEWARRAARDAGVFVGISSGAAICAAEHLAAREEFAGKTIVTILPSYGERYLTSPLFAHIGE